MSDATTDPKEIREAALPYAMGLNADELKQYCRDFNIRGYSKLRKGELAQFLVENVPDAELSKFHDNLVKDIVNRYFKKARQLLDQGNPVKLAAVEYKASGKSDKENDNKSGETGKPKDVGPNGILNLYFQAFWGDGEISLQMPKLENKKEPLVPLFECTCGFSKEGGLCEHFWLGLAWFFQQFDIDPDRWQKTPLPDGFLEAVPEIDFSSFLAGKEFDKTYESVEECLIEEYLGKVKYTADTIEERLKRETTDDLREFMKSEGIQDPDPEASRPRKAKLIQAMLKGMTREKLAETYFRHTIEGRFEFAREIPADIINVVWGPPLSCEASVLAPFEGEPKDFKISIKRDAIQHPDCHWNYHRDIFCTHLLSLFLELGEQDQDQTLAYLGRLRTKLH